MIKKFFKSELENESFEISYNSDSNDCYLRNHSKDRYWAFANSFHFNAGDIDRAIDILQKLKADIESQTVEDKR